jgi:hypothetical protein
MLTFVGSPGDSQQNVTFQPTLSLEREFGSSADLFVEYVGDYDHQPPAQLVDAGGAWRFTTTQQIDFHVGFGVNRSSPECIRLRLVARHVTRYSVDINGEILRS